MADRFSRVHRQVDLRALVTRYNSTSTVRWSGRDKLTPTASGRFRRHRSPLAQALGVQFASVGNDTVIDWQAAGADAQLQMREAGEFADVDIIDAVPLLHVQPEDKLALSYAPGGDAPAHASSAHVITSKSTRAGVDENGNRTWEASYQILGFRT